MSNQEQFKAGDVVKLKSNSLELTIESIDKYDDTGHATANCIWFMNNEIKKESIALAALTKLR